MINVNPDVAVALALVRDPIATVNASRRHRVLAAQTLRSLTGEAETLHRERGRDTCIAALADAAMTSPPALCTGGVLSVCDFGVAGRLRVNRWRLSATASPAPSSPPPRIFAGGGSVHCLQESVAIPRPVVLLREINEWRARARVPPLATPVRPDAHEVVLRAETEDFDLLEEVLELEEDEDEVREEDVTNTRNGNGSPVSPQTQETAIDRSRPRSVSISTAPDFARGSEAASFAPPFTPVYQAQFSAPLPFGESPSSPASSASGGWDGPATPPASAGPMHGMVLSQPLAHAQRLAPLQTGGPPKGYEPYFDAMPGSAGAAYDLGPAFDGAESVFLGGGAGMGTRAGGDTGMGWVERNASHPAFHYQQAAHNAIPPRDHQHMRVARAERDAANRMEMGGARMGMQMGVAAGRYLHQGARFA
ncbi:hypothetical protein C8R47DRAFT_1209362 [Mycena vitilis]|nr:hypothetical protein C8R47DRAFT_1209362 [Mycena vitilis]